MAQTGYTPIQLYSSNTASAVPTAGNLASGELAINTVDEKLYFKNSAGAVKLLAANVTPVANGGTGVTTAASIAALVGDFMYPVGSIYINAGVSTNPSTLLGFGTWTAFGTGRVLVGVDAADAPFDTLGETGGSKDATVISHTHTATVTDPGHTHLTGTDSNVISSVSGSAAGFSSTSGSSLKNTAIQSTTTGISVGISTIGSSGTNANLQPYITVAMWKRTA